jgi:hypothetical protein
VVTHGWRSRQIAWKSDCVITFAHAAWSGRRVAVFVDGSVCGQIRAAYDTASDKVLDFKVVEPWLRAAIIDSYKVTPEELGANNGDVFAWASYPGDGEPRRSTEEFRRRYQP